jgi:beta-lactamase class A
MRLAGLGDLMGERNAFMGLRRRHVAGVALSVLAAPAIVRRAEAQGVNSRVQAAVARFAALPAASCLVIAEHPTAPWQASHAPATRLFVGSAVKTFILAQCLRAVEAGLLNEDRQTTIDDTVRSPSSPVFLNLTGTTPLRCVLEAMITHSDNTATDVALAAAELEHVRSLIAEAGLRATHIPNSTRRLFSYLAGAPEGVDVGWDGMKRLANGPSIGTVRPALNDKETMASTAEDMVRWYQLALRGTFFKEAATLVEFKRIQSMADAIAQIVPAGIAAYAKGGSIDWEGFHCFCIAGQMVVGKVPVTFCFTINWTGPDDGVAANFHAYKTAVADVLAEAARVASGG